MPARNPIEFDLQDAFGTLVEIGGTLTLSAEVGGALPSLFLDYDNAVPAGNPYSIPPGTSKVLLYAPAGVWKLEVSVVGVGVAVRRHLYLGTARGLDIEDIANALVNTSILSAPVIKTADFTVAATEKHLINNKAGSTCVVTLPVAASFSGRELVIKNLQAQTVVSVSSNVVPRNSTTAGTAILASGAGNWALLVSNGTNWVIMAGS